MIIDDDDKSLIYARCDSRKHEFAVDTPVFSSKRDNRKMTILKQYWQNQYPIE